MINYALIGEALLHPMKKAILKAMESNQGAAGRHAVFSPKQLSKLLGEPLGNVSYHVNDLAGRSKDSKFIDSPFLVLVDTQQRRGALERLYRLSPKAVKGTK